MLVLLDQDLILVDIKGKQGANQGKSQMEIMRPWVLRASTRGLDSGPGPPGAPTSGMTTNRHCAARKHGPNDRKQELPPTGERFTRPSEKERSLAPSPSLSHQGTGGVVVGKGGVKACWFTTLTQPPPQGRGEFVAEKGRGGDQSV
jgi:hypothetical protein